jgi:NAD(P)-dependent dehydrogenase (short-subunit alcohol dehydrogenase family)
VTKDGIYINALAPVIIPTPIVTELTKKIGRPDAEQKLKDMDFTKAYPVGRFGVMEDAARAVSYMVENNWMVGSVLEINGGLAAV